MARVGTKKTLFVNFSTICSQLNRDQAHLTTYILAELGTQGSVDASGGLLIKGRYQSKHMEPVLRNYCRKFPHVFMLMKSCDRILDCIAKYLFINEYDHFL